jgi:hypothetical protein
MEYNEKTISVYDATQVQRKIERTIRFWKRQVSALESAGLSHVAESAKVAEWQGVMRDFILQMNKQKEFQWYRQRIREQI